MSTSNKPESRRFTLTVPEDVKELSEDVKFNVKIDNNADDSKMQSMDGQTFFKDVDVNVKSDGSISSNSKFDIDIAKYMKSIDELLEVEEDLVLAKQYKQRQEKRIGDMNKAISAY